MTTPTRWQTEHNYSFWRLTLQPIVWFFLGGQASFERQWSTLTGINESGEDDCGCLVGDGFPPF